MQAEHAPLSSPHTAKLVQQMTEGGHLQQAYDVLCQVSAHPFPDPHPPVPKAVPATQVGSS